MRHHKSGKTLISGFDTTRQRDVCCSKDMQRAAGLSCDRTIMGYTHVEQRATLLTLSVSAITAERVLNHGNLIYLIWVDDIQKCFY
jgi:hypothetical protein